MSSFNRWQAKQLKRTVAQGQLNSSFVMKGYPSITIEGMNNEKIAAAVVNKQEQDYAYFYTLIDKPLTIGSIWKVKSLYFLIAEEIVIIKDVRWHKYMAYLCNTQIGDKWGYFKGPQKSFINLNLKQNVILESQQHPVLVLPEGSLSIGDKVLIKNRAWLVQEHDSISTHGISYYSLVPTTVSSTIYQHQETIEKPGEVKKPYDNISYDENYNLIYSYNHEIELSTEQGYIQTAAKINILRHEEQLIVFTVPFGVKQFEVEILEKGQKVIKTFKLGE